jgi:hypothetical protein
MVNNEIMKRAVDAMTLRAYRASQSPPSIALWADDRLLKIQRERRCRR